MSTDARMPENSGEKTRDVCRAYLAPGWAVDPRCGLAFSDPLHACTWEPFRNHVGSHIRWERSDLQYRVVFFDAEPPAGAGAGSAHALWPPRAMHESLELWARPDRPATTWLTCDYTFAFAGYARIDVRPVDPRRTPGWPETAQDVFVRVEHPAGASVLPRHFAHEVRRVAARVDELREAGDFVCAVVADPHHRAGDSWEDTARNVAALARATRLDAVVHLGDLTDGSLPKAAARAVSRAMLDDLAAPGVPVWGCVGNHDFNELCGPQQRFSAREAGELLLGAGDPWRAVDVPASGLRLLFLNSYDPRMVGGPFGFYPEELDWVRTTLDQTPCGWSVLVFSHVPPLERLHTLGPVRGGTELVGMLRQFDRRGSGRVLAFVCGHAHADFVDDEPGFSIVGVGCSKSRPSRSDKPAGFHVWDRTPGTASLDLWDVLVAKPQTGRVEFVRFGAGRDRSAGAQRRCGDGA